MSVAVMDGGFQLKRPWQDPPAQSSPSSSPIIPMSHPTPESSRARMAPFSASPDCKIPPISTTVSPPPPPRRGIISPTSYSADRSPLYGSPRPFSARPEKRARLNYSHSLVATTPICQDGEGLGQSATLDISRKCSSTSIAEEGSQSPPYVLQDCPNCSDTEALVAAVVSGLLGLEAEIKIVLCLSKDSQAIHEGKHTEQAKQGLRQSLMWAANSISGSSRMVRDVAIAQGEVMPLAPFVASAERPSQPDPVGTTPAPMAHPHTALDAHHKDHLDDLVRRPLIATSSDKSYRSFDTLPPILSLDQMKKGQNYDQGYSRPAQSPYCSSSGSVFGSVTSPMQSQHSSRQLPSPSTFQYPPSASVLSGTYSPTHSQAAQAAHAQDLQHQISTKTLALETLQREHDQLLAAFSRSQIRCSTLDRKSQVSDHEINSLSEEKANLQQQLEALESQVEELAKARDDAQKQSQADGTQWRQIMAMSSQLQAKGAEETRRFRVEKEGWERDRAGLQQRIQELEAGKLTFVQFDGSAGSTTAIASDDILASASLDALREEIVRLRRSCGELEALLQDIKHETEQMGHALTTISGIRERIRGQTRSGLREHEP